VGLSLFNKTLAPAPFAAPNNQEFSLALGTTTLVNWTSTLSLTFVGISALAGNVDGMVVCFVNLNANGFTLSIAHDSGFASRLTNRCLNAGGATATAGVGGALWYRLNGLTGRWHQLGRA
jgi:hypothetical protein